jgi:hypothetical protein
MGDPLAGNRLGTPLQRAVQPPSMTCDHRRSWERHSGGRKVKNLKGMSSLLLAEVAPRASRPGRFGKPSPIHRGGNGSNLWMTLRASGAVTRGAGPTNQPADHAAATKLQPREPENPPATTPPPSTGATVRRRRALSRPPVPTASPIPAYWLPTQRDSAILFPALNRRQKFYLRWTGGHALRNREHGALILAAELSRTIEDIGVPGRGIVAFHHTGRESQEAVAFSHRLV